MALVNDRKQYNGFYIARDDEGFGNVIVLQTAWNRNHLSAILKHKIKAIILSKHNGWLESDVSFFADVFL